jgi:hypothetical protein
MLSVKNKLFSSVSLIAITILLGLVVTPLQVHALDTIALDASTPYIRVEKIKFYWGSSSKAVQMIDHVTDKVLPVPEWDYSEGTDEPACYVRGTTIVIQAKFRLLGYYNAIGGARIWANGSLGGLGERPVRFTNGWSEYVSFRALESLPDVVSVVNVTWDWWYRDVNGRGTPPVKMPASSRHEIFSVWSAPLDPPIYKSVARWTTQWATGAGDANTTKDIADAIISKEHLSGLHYGYAAWTVDDILDIGGGMCGGWYKMFHEMCGDQGVFVYDGCYILKRDAAPYPEKKWIGIVIKDGGLNNPEPTWPYRWWYDVDTTYPYPNASDVHAVYERRYIFFSPYDGHCINFLLYDGEVYLYDASFGTGPWPGTFDHIPSGDYTGKELHDFRANYHDIAIDHMEGTIYMSDGSTETLDVKSSLIPDLRVPEDPSTFEMHYYFTSSQHAYIEERMKELRSLIARIKPFADVEEPPPFDEELDKCIEELEPLLSEPNKAVELLDVLETICRLGQIGNVNVISTLMDVLGRSEEVVVSPGSPLPTSMTPLEMLKSAAIDSITTILTRIDG